MDLILSRRKLYFIRVCIQVYHIYSLTWDNPRQRQRKEIVKCQLGRLKRKVSQKSPKLKKTLEKSTD